MIPKIFVNHVILLFTKFIEQKKSIKSSKLFKFRKSKKKNKIQDSSTFKIIIANNFKIKNLDSKFVDQNKSNAVNI